MWKIVLSWLFGVYFVELRHAESQLNPSARVLYTYQLFVTQRHEIFCRGYNEDFEISVRRFGEVGLIYNDLSFLELVPVFFAFGSLKMRHSRLQ